VSGRIGRRRSGSFGGFPPELLVDMGIEPGTEEQAVRGLIARRDVVANPLPETGRAEKVAFALYPR